VVRTARPGELPALSAFIARFQAKPATRIAYFGASAAAIAAEIESWGSGWSDQCLVAERGEEVLGFVGVDVDHELGRAWIHGPFVEDQHWDVLADRMLHRAVAVAGVDDLELVGDAANERLSALALRNAFSRGRLSFALEIDRERVARLPNAVLPRLEGSQRAAFAALHEKLFPRTYYSGAQLAEQSAGGEATVLVLVEHGRLVGYAVGRIDSGGEGYVDFVGVTEDARGSGRGRRLMTAICQALLEQPERSKVSLTVYEDNRAALALYDALGFTRAASMIGFRRLP
jgi:ribosomal protein S18 acetylase RimI-like enzyme